MKIEELKQRLEQVADLNGAASLLGWDQQTYMPPAGGPARAEQLATLGRLAHQILTADETATLLESAAVEVASLDPKSDEARLFAVVRRDFD